MSSALFSPLRLAELALDNRIVVAPMCQYSSDDGVQCEGMAFSPVSKRVA